MRRFALALLVVLGLSWGLAPHLPLAPGAVAGQGLGSERAYIEASGGGPVVTASALAAAVPVWLRAWRRPVSSRLRYAPPLLPSRRLFLRLQRLQLEGG